MLMSCGVTAKEQLNLLENGVDIVVGTPGRIDFLYLQGNLSLSQVQLLDEADGSLSQGYSDFYGQIPRITSDGKRLQVIVGSATLHSFVKKFYEKKNMHFPI